MATVLAALSFVAAVALRGYVPGADPVAGHDAAAADDPLALTVVAVLLAAAVGVMVVAVIVRLRHRVVAPTRVVGRVDWRRGDRGKPTWRVASIVFGLILAWLAVVAVLSGLGERGDAPRSMPGATPTGAGPASPGDEPRTPARPESDAGGPDVLSYLYGATGVVLLVIVAGSLVAARRRPAAPVSAAPPGDETGPEPVGDAESFARAAEVGLAEVGDQSREPRKAIIACYAAMERELALLPDAAPREFDTASEVLARAVDQRALAPDSATRLVDLFDEARFSPHVMDEGHRDAAVAVLTHVLGELRSRA